MAFYSKNKGILIITTKLDPHADAVIDKVSDLGYEVFRLNSEDLLCKYIFTLSHESKKNDGIIQDAYGRKIAIQNIQSAYYRKPQAVKPHSELTDQGAKYFSEQEGEEFLKNIYANKSIKWINDPYAIKRAQIKLPQLQVASSVGLRVPKTIITNNINDAKIFFKRHNYDIICKSLITTSIPTEQGALHAFTHALSKKEIEQNIESIKYAPTLLQERIMKASEIRVTIIGEHIFACKIDSQSIPEAQEDWRATDPISIPHEAIDLPQNINQALITLLRKYNLQFGAIDLIKTPEDEYVFLEKNPNGQWYWIEMLTGMPMAKTMAELLSSNIDE